MTPSGPWALLRRAVARGRVAHAYLFAGPAGQGQREAAVRLAQALRCPEAREGEPCGNCLECRRIAEGLHPACVWVRPAGASLKLEQVREAVRPLQWRAAAGEYRVVVFEDAERLTPEAANRLLKVLEEPPPYAVLVLLAEAPERLPETVVSRCQVFYFHGVPEGVLAERLQAAGEIPLRALALARLAGGNVGRAEAWRVSGLLDGPRRAVLDGLARLLDGDPLTALALADAWAAGEPDPVLVSLEVLIRDLALVRRGLADYVWNVDVQAALCELAARLRSLDPEAALQAVARARRALEAHAPRQLVFEVLCLRLQQILCA